MSETLLPKNESELLQAIQAAETRGAQVMLESIREFLRFRAGGVEMPGDAVIMMLVDRIAAKAVIEAIRAVRVRAPGAEER